MEEILIAPCGMNCALCSAYLAQQYDLKKTGILRSYCAGCRPDNRNCHYKRQCNRLGKGLVRFCYECTDFPCRWLKTLDKRYRTKYHMSMIENLEYIRDRGMTAFLDKEAEKWRCPECGAVICCHNGLCFRCDLEKLKAKRYKYQWGDE